MTALTPYFTLRGQARPALEFYRDVFGGDIEQYTFGEFGRADGEPDGVAHGILTGPVSLFAADGAGAQQPVGSDGLMLALLGTADAATSTARFRALAVGGEVINDLQQRPRGYWDGQVRGRYGVTWLIDYAPEA